MEKLGNLCDFISGVTFNKAEAVSSPLPRYLPILRAGNIGDTLNTQDDFVWVPSDKVSKEQRLQVGDIVMCMSSGSPHVVGKSAWVEGQFAGSAGAFCSIIRPKKREQQKYLAYWFKSGQFLRWRDNQARGINIQNLRASQLRLVEIPLPPLPEQQHIAAVLAKADRLRRLRRTARELSDTYLQSVFVHIFGDPGSNPKEWNSIAIEKVLSKDRAGTQTGPFGSSLKRHEYVEEGIPVWGIDNVRENEFVEDRSLFITPSKYRELSRYTVEDGDILLSRAGTIGRMCVAHPTQHPSIIGTNLVRVAVDASVVLPGYFTALFTYFSDRMGNMSSGGTAYSFVNPRTLKALEIPLPPLPLQQQFTAIVRKFERLRAQQREAERQAEHLFQALLERAFTRAALWGEE